MATDKQATQRTRGGTPDANGRYPLYVRVDGTVKKALGQKCRETGGTETWHTQRALEAYLGLEVAAEGKREAK